MARRNNPPLLPGDVRWDPAWIVQVDDSADNYRDIYIIDSDAAVIGEIGVLKSNHVPGAWNVSGIDVDPHYTGRGLGQALYLLAMRLVGKIHPDWETAVSPSALRAWKALRRSGRVKSVYHRAFDRAKVEDVDFDNYPEDAPRPDVLSEDDQIITLPGAWPIALPKGWQGVLDQVYQLRDPASVPLVKLKV